MAEETKRGAATKKMVKEMEMAKEMEYKHIHCMLHLRQEQEKQCSNIYLRRRP